MVPKGDFPHIRYIFDRHTYLGYRRLMKTFINSQKFDHSDVAQFRFRVLTYFERWGLKPTLDAFGVSKTSLYRWRTHYQRGKSLVTLVPCSTRPHHLRVMTTDRRFIALISALRKEHGNLGSHLLKPFVDAFALQINLPSISTKTIEKIIKRYHFTYEGKRKYRRKSSLKRLRNRYAPKVKEPGFIQVDGITLHMDGCHYRFLSVIDIYTKLAYVRLVDHLSADSSLLAFQHFQTISSFPVHTVQTDNGSEFLSVFHENLIKEDVVHLFIYPHSPKINGVVERFNRTIQEEFLTRSTELHIDRVAFEGKLEQYLHWYNTVRPHAALHYVAPQQFINQIPKCP